MKNPSVGGGGAKNKNIEFCVKSKKNKVLK